MIYALGVLICWIAPKGKNESVRLRAAVALGWPILIPLFTLLALFTGDENV